MRILFGLLLPVLASALVLTGCQAVHYDDASAPAMVVSSQLAPVFFQGPTQFKGMDANLVKGAEVYLLTKEVGYSYVRLYDGRRGYMANDDLAPAPKPSPTPKLKSKSKPLVHQKTASKALPPPQFRY
jgi:hypothetical protein